MVEMESSIWKEYYQVNLFLHTIKKIKIYSTV